MMSGSAFFTTYVSVYLESIHFSSTEIGMIQSANFLGILIGGFRMESLIRRVGHIQALTVFGSVATCSILLQALFLNLPAWIFFRFLNGLSLAALYIVIESWMLNHSNIKNRGIVLSLYMIAFLSSQSVSQQLLSFIDIDSTTPYLISAILTSVGIIPVGLSTKKIVLEFSYEPISFGKIIKTSPFGVIGCLTAGLILSAFYSFFPLYSLSIGIPAENLMSITIAGGVVLQWPVGYLSDYFDRRKSILAVVLVSLVLAGVSFGYDGDSHNIIYVIMFLVGGFFYALYPLSIAQVCDHLKHEQITTATALMLIAFGIGSVLGPILCSGMIEILEIRAIFLYFFILLGILGGIGFLTTLRRPIVPLEEQTEFQSMPNVTPIAYEMDPRGEE